VVTNENIEFSTGVTVLLRFVSQWWMAYHMSHCLKCVLWAVTTEELSFGIVINIYGIKLKWVWTVFVTYPNSLT